MSLNREFNIAIIGSGPASLSAAIYASRGGFKTVVIGDLQDSRLFAAHLIENFFGFPEGIEGSDLLKRGIAQAQKFGTVISREEVIRVKKRDESFIVKTIKGEYEISALIFASGVKNNSSGIARENEFRGRGISFCVTCDGSFFKNKKVVVVGEGDFAAEEVLELLQFTDHVELFLNGLESRISKTLTDKIKEKKIRVNKGVIKEFLGENKVAGLLMENGVRIETDGVFLAQGFSSSFKLATEVEVDTKNDFIIADENGKTNVAGIFAAGDVTGKGMQVATAVGSGAKAAISAMAYLKGLEK